MKYEMIFGDERLADKFTNENSVFIVYRGHGVYFEFESGNDGVNYIANSCSIGDSFYMRRIIKEPKRWTWEDKKAGVLPEVGSIFTYRDETLTCHFIDGDGEIWAHDIDNKIVTPLLRDCKPIETPREKYDRERDECIDKLLAKIPPSPITVVPAMKIVYEELKPFTGGDHD